MQIQEPKIVYFKDDGVIPNSKLPLLVYPSAFEGNGDGLAEKIEKTFAANNWINSWRWGVYPFHHYHSNTHEVLGVYQGTATLLMGGEKGEKLTVKAGDVLIIPAGVGHKCLTHSDDFNVVGAYPNGLKPDLRKGEPTDRPSADVNINKVPKPATDPIQGKNLGLTRIWK
ncbi:cupin domain-containing protein [Sphingobacterium hungaricum]|nr:cupin domain-containing protein [Sphingobacterium hungaricum]